MCSLFTRKIRALLIDINGVLHESAFQTAIPGSVRAVELLKKRNLPYLFVTNETKSNRKELVRKLSKIGYEISIKDVYSPPPACRAYIEAHKLRPHLLVHPDVRTEFDGLNENNPNCVVVAYAGDYFSYGAVNKAFQILTSMKKPLILSMGKSRYFKENNELFLGLGAYTAALEYACDTQAVIIGKPSKNYFLSALKTLGNISPADVAMIGDDIVGDVAGAQASGISGILVRTGKFRPERDEHHANIQPDLIVNDLLEAVNLICESN